MKTNRDAICNDIRRVVRLPVTDFLWHFLPPQRLTQEELGVVTTKLTEGWCIHAHFNEAMLGIKRARFDAIGRASAPLGVVNNETRWTDYATPPSQREGSEQDVYADLVDIYGQVVQRCLEVKDGLEQTCALKSNGARSLPSQKVNTAMPGGVHQLKIEFGGMFDWDSTVVAEEYKLLKGAQQSPADEDDEDVGAGSDVEEDEEESDAFEDEYDDSENQTVADLLLDNSKKVIWSMHHIMRTDARRRFTFGITIADTEVRLWHVNRAVIVASQSFDLNTDANLVIDVYSRLAFAIPEELGYDLSMERLLSDPDPSPDRTNGKRWKNQYRIMVCDEPYITVKTLANQGAEYGFGTCTRVFRAYKESDRLIDADKRQYYAIKDNWLEKGRRTECEIYDEIMKRIEAHDWQGLYNAAPASRMDYKEYDKAHRKPADPLYGLSADERKKFFIKVIGSEEVKVNGVVDDTHDVIGRRVTFPQEDRKYLAVCDGAKLHVNDRAVLSGFSGNMHKTLYGDDEDGRFDGVIPARRHHRTVMEEAATLLDLPDIKTTFATVKDASYALFILHSIGMLFRDVSPGNILRRKTESSGRGVLADLEYVKCVTETQSHGARTGTADFCAVEVASGDFLIPEETASPTIPPDDNDGDQPSAPVLPVAGRDLQQNAWRFRDVHDLESIFWLILWLLLRYDTNEQVPAEYDPLAKRRTFNKIFPHYRFENKPERVAVLTKDPALDKVLALLPPTWTLALGNALRHFRIALMEVYGGPKRQPLPPTMWALIYVTCARGERIESSFTDSFVGMSCERRKRKRRMRRASSNAAHKAVGTNRPSHSAQTKRGHDEMDGGVEEVAGELAGADSARSTWPEPKRRKGETARR
ncbi:uncharacterized protein SCHCODRAFT_02534121 [Schizophyllum commune H4-8]|nr:uncharacterized protein SCHCODRAFT_02534121 [Schizophyllum commune H4-8]KAI5897151.1 hypothetical protein SCHCODRAFT_02534121 [Schizophyllum commune H4-8]